MSMAEAALGIAVFGFALAVYSFLPGEEARRLEAAQAARVVVDLHEAAERYLSSPGVYRELVQCLSDIDGDGTEDPLASLGSEWAGVSGFRAVPVLEMTNAVAATPPDDFSSVWANVEALSAAEETVVADRLGPASALPCGDGSAPRRPRGLADLGLVPASLSGLRYSMLDGGAHLWGLRRYRFSLLVRLVEPEPGGRRLVQGLVVAAPEAGPSSALEHVSLVTALTELPDAGLVSSASPPGANGRDQNLMVLGFAGGWSMGFCGLADAAEHLALRGSAGGPLVRCGNILDEPDEGGRGLSRISLAEDRAAGGRSATDLLAAFGVVPVSTLAGRLRDADGNLTGPEAGRVVVAVSRRADAALQGVLYRVGTGDPEANRMETDVDHGGWGALNTGYVAGVDSDGDGAVDRGVRLVGGEGEAGTVIHGDLKIRGNVVVEGREGTDPAVAVAGRVSALQLHAGGGDWDPGGTPSLLSVGPVVVQGAVMEDADGNPVADPDRPGRVSALQLHAGGGDWDPGGTPSLLSVGPVVVQGGVMEDEHGNPVADPDRPAAVRLRDWGDSGAAWSAQFMARALEFQEAAETSWRARLDAASLRFRGPDPDDPDDPGSGFEVDAAGHTHLRTGDGRFLTLDAARTLLRGQGGPEGFDGDDLSLVRPLQAMAGRYTLGGIGPFGDLDGDGTVEDGPGGDDRFSCADYYGGGTVGGTTVASPRTVLVAVPHGWRRSLSPVEVVDVDGGTVQLAVPFQGWSADPETGFDDGTPGPRDEDTGDPIPREGRASIIALCDWGPPGVPPSP